MSNIFKFELFKMIRIKQLYLIFLIEGIFTIGLYIFFITGIFKLFIKYPNDPKFGLLININKYNAPLVILAQIGILISLIIIPFFVSIIFSTDYEYKTIQYAESKGINKINIFLCKYLTLFLISLINIIFIVFVSNILSSYYYKEIFSIFYNSPSNFLFYMFFLIICISIVSLCILINRFIKFSIISFIVSIFSLIILAYFILSIRYILFSPLGFYYYIEKNHYFLSFFSISIILNLFILLFNGYLYNNK